MFFLHSNLCDLIQRAPQTHMLSLGNTYLSCHLLALDQEAAVPALSTEGTPKAWLMDLQGSQAGSVKVTGRVTIAG